MGRIQRWILVLGLVFAPAVAAAQTAPEESNPLADVLFEAELVMQHRRAIGLTDEQRDAISRMIEELQGRVVRLQWELLDETESLKEILDRPRIDQDRALDQLERVLDKEKGIKQTHLELLIRLKNVLSPEQQRELTRLRAEQAGQAAARGPGS